MKLPNISQIAARPTGLLNLHHRPQSAPFAPLNTRNFTATTRRPFLDVVLVQTHTLINGIHTTTGLPWAAHRRPRQTRHKPPGTPLAYT